MNPRSLPAMNQVKQILDLASCSSEEVNELLSRSLIDPIQDLLERPSKGIRARLLEAGFRLSDAHSVERELTAEELHRCEQCGQVLEALHAGSLIVDDIQDNSKVRRGDLTLHRKYGIPVALNAGNWLYFWPMHLIETLGLPAEKELAAYRLCNRTLIRAHFGQALDVGTPIDEVSQQNVHDICLASLELKSGALMALALTLGALMGDASQKRIRDLSRFGHKFGIALQMFDDFGNLKAKPDLQEDLSKQREDLMLRRPSWVWAVAARDLSAEQYQSFVAAVRALPDEGQLDRFLAEVELVKLGRESAKVYLNEAIALLKKTCQEDPVAMGIVMNLGERLTKAYE